MQSAGQQINLILIKNVEMEEFESYWKCTTDEWERI